jgi:ABC exporter DevB family membrane fusion protein
MRKLVWCGALAALAGAAIWWWVASQLLKSDGGGEGAARPLPNSLTVKAVGHIEPASELCKLVARATGVVRRYYVRAGDTMHKGDRIMELDASTQQAELELARRQLALAEAEAEDVGVGLNPYRIKVTEHTIDRLREKLRHATAESDRRRRLFDSQASSPEEFDEKNSQKKQLEHELQEQLAELQYERNYVTAERRAMLAAKVRQAQAGVSLAEERLRETYLCAPMDGTVLKLLKLEGDGVSTLNPEPVVLFGDLSRLRVRAEVEERFVRFLSPGQEVVVEGPNLGERTYRGQISRLERVMGDKTVFTRASAERKDLEVLQVIIDAEAGFSGPIGLRVDVRIHVGD